MSKLTVLTNLDRDQINSNIDNKFSELQSSTENILSDAKAYTDEKDVAMKAVIDDANTANLEAAKAYTDEMVSKELQSNYDLWLSVGYEGTQADFIEFLRGDSAYETWLKQEGNEGKSVEEFFESIGGGEVSWNDLTDKPFGEETGYGDTLYIPTSVDGLEFVDGLYKISNATPSIDDLVNGVIIKFDGENTGTINVSYETILEGFENYGALMLCDGILVISEEIGGEFSGIYASSGYMIPTINYSITIPNYSGFKATTVKHIEEKFIPDTIARKSDLTGGATDFADMTVTDTGSFLGTENASVNAQELASNMMERIISLEALARELDTI